MQARFVQADLSPVMANNVNASSISGIDATEDVAIHNEKPFHPRSHIMTSI